MVRITSANCGSGWLQTFSFDPVGNITKNGSMQFQPVYNMSRNRISTVGSTTAQYDNNGNVLNDGVNTYAWDADGNSITVDAVGATFDALDRMVEQNRSSVYTEIVYAPTGVKLAVMSGTTGQTLQNAFINLPGQATAVYTSSGLDHYRHADWLGSARLTSSPSQTVLSATAYAPFGETYATYPNPSASADPSFTGQNSDTVSGDYDFLAREYSTQGRWPSPDPAGRGAVNPMNPQSWNRYAYVLNNPLTMTDHLGLDCVYDNGDGSVNIESGDCGSPTDAGYYVDCDGCLFDSANNAYSPVLNQETGALFFADANGNAISGTSIEGFADPTGNLYQSITVNDSGDPGVYTYSYSFSNSPLQSGNGPSQIGKFQTNFTNGDVVCTRKGCLDLGPETQAKVCQQVSMTVGLLGLMVAPEVGLPVWAGKVLYGVSSAAFLGGMAFCGQ